MTGPHSSHDLFYRRLGVGSDASRDEIVHAYRRLAHRAHPDVHPGDPDAARRFREITEAYEVLADPSRRAGYDRTRAARPIRVVIRPAEGGPVESSWAGRVVVAADPIVFLGATRQSIGEVPFRAGPVRVEATSQASPSRRGHQQAVVMHLIARMFDAWGQP
jgi:curved DNA-binding protein CbpA